MEPQKKTYYVVEIGGADLYFDNLQKASDFFAKIVQSGAEKISSLGYGSDAYHYKHGVHTPLLKQEILDVYPTEKAARFAKSNEETKDESE